MKLNEMNSAGVGTTGKVAGSRLELPTVGWNVSRFQIDIQILLTSVVTNNRNRSSVRMELHRPKVSQFTADNAVVMNKSFVNHTKPFKPVS